LQVFNKLKFNFYRFANKQAFGIQLFDSINIKYKMKPNNVEISTKEGIWTFIDKVYTSLKYESLNIYRITLLILLAPKFPTIRHTDHFLTLNPLKKFNNIPHNLYPTDYKDLIPYALKLLSQNNYPMYFRIFFETFIEHEPIENPSITNAITLCNRDISLFNYENMGLFQFYTEYFTGDIWQHMKLSFIYFLKVCQFEAGYSKYCEIQLLKKKKKKKKKINYLKLIKKNDLEDSCLICKNNSDIQCCEQTLYCKSCAEKLAERMNYVSCWICKKILYP